MKHNYFTLLLCMLLSSGILLSCRKNHHCSESITRIIPVPGFKKLHFKDDFDVSVIQADSFSLVMEGCLEDVHRAKAHVSNGILNMQRSSGESNHGIKVQISCPDWSEVKMDGTVKMSLSGFQTPANRNIITTGTGTLNFEGHSHILSIKAQGTSTVVLKGLATGLDIHQSGVSFIKAFECAVSDCSIFTEGNSKSQLFVTDKLYGVATGTSEIKYKGAAAVSVECREASKITKEAQ